MRIYTFEVGKQMAWDEDVSSTIDVLEKIVNRAHDLLLRQEMEEGLVTIGRERFHHAGIVTQLLQHFSQRSPSYQLSIIVCRQDAQSKLIAKDNER